MCGRGLSCYCELLLQSDLEVAASLSMCCLVLSIMPDSGAAQGQLLHSTLLIIYLKHVEEMVRMVSQ